MATTGIHGDPLFITTDELQPEDRSRGSFGNFDAVPTEEHVEVPKADSLLLLRDDVVPEKAQRSSAAASLRDRTVARGQAHGAAAGTVVAAAGVGVAAGVLIGIGKGALIGAALGSIVPGVGTAVGAVLGAAIGGVAVGLVASGVGALIGRALAGGSDRERGEKLILGLHDRGQITTQQANDLRGLSNSDLSDLVSISARKTGIRDKADRDAIRSQVLVTAAKRGPDEAKQLKAKLIFDKIVDQPRPEVGGEFLKSLIDDAVGRPGAGHEIFTQLHLGGEVKRADLALIKTLVNQQTKVNRAAKLREHLPALAAGVLKYARDMGNAPEGSIAEQNPDKDFFRPSGNQASTPIALGKLESAGRVEDANLSRTEAVQALKTIWQATPTMPAEKFTKLIMNEAVSDAVGYFTGRNTVGQKEVPLDDPKAQPENMHKGAKDLKAAIDANLTPPEKEALRERAAFLRNMAALSLRKAGPTNARGDEAEIQKELWIKSMAVSSNLFSGHEVVDVANASGLPAKEVAIQARDFITACAIHYDAIFPNDLGPGGEWPRAVDIQATMPDRKQEQLVQEINANLKNSKPESGLADQFWSDIDRQTRVTVVHSDGDEATLTAGGQPQAELKELVGSDEAAYHLSRFLTQTPLESMTGAMRVEDSAGRRVLPMLSPDRTQGVTVTRHDNKETGESIIEMEFALEGSLRGLNVDPPGDDLTTRPQLLEAEAGSHFSYRTRLQIPLAALESGEVEAYRIVEPPRLELQASVKPS
jgi:hypothetical protein